MSSLDYLKKVNVPKLILVIFMFCTIVSGLYSAMPLYEEPDITVITEEIPEYELLLKNETWTPPERILLANLTPSLEDPSWYSSESATREYNARIVNDNDSSILFFNNQTVENENYTWPAHATWSLLWPFAVLNYTEVTAEWHIRVLLGNTTVDSLFTIGRGYDWTNIRGGYVPNSNTEMNASAGDEITLVSSASNFTEYFTYMEIGYFCRSRFYCCC
jgi:hypothetical protein